MRVHILGCGDAFGSGGRNQSSYLVAAGDRSFLLDCGPAALLAMKRAGLDSQRLDAILISHLHGDHFGGIPFFLIEYLYLKPRSYPLVIAGPPGTEERVRQLYAILYGSGKTAPEFPWLDFVVLRPERRQTVAGVDVFPFRVPHQTDDISLGLKVAYGGKQVLFSGDSMWTDLFVEHARGADLFLCECSFLQEQPGMHMNYGVLEENLSRLQCKKLLLVHLGEAMLARKDQLAVGVAEDGMVVEI